MGIKQKIWSFKEGIKNLIVWLPIIWKDRQWHQKSFYTILIRKLEMMSECFYANDQLHRANQMQTSLENLKRIRDEVTFSEYHDSLYKKWGEPEIQSIAHPEDGTNDLIIIHPKVRSHEEGKKFEEAHKSMIQTIEHKEKQEKNQAFNTIRDNIQDWWI